MLAMRASETPHFGWTKSDPSPVQRCASDSWGNALARTQTARKKQRTATPIFCRRYRRCAEWHLALVVRRRRAFDRNVFTVRLYFTVSIRAISSYFVALTPANLLIRACTLRGHLYKFAWAAAPSEFIDMRLGEGADN